MANEVCLYRSDDPSSPEFYELYLQQAHRIILMATCPFLYEQFKSNENLEESSNCFLPQVSANVVRLFLELVYTSKTYGPSKEIDEAMKLAEMFGVRYLANDDRIESDDDPTCDDTAGTSTEEPQLNPDPIEIVDEPQVSPEENYNELLKTMTFKQLSSSCVICHKFYPDLKKHLKKSHPYRRKYNWQCARCKNTFFWLKKECHVCQN